MNLDNLLIQGGELYLGAFRPGTTAPTGVESPIGNIKSLTHNKTTEKLEHFNNKNGKRVKDRTVETSVSHSLVFVVDNIDFQALSLRFGGTPTKVAQAAATDTSETFQAVAGNRWLQLGSSDSTPTGVREVTVTEVTRGATPLVNRVDYVVNASEGRVYIMDTGADAEDITVTYDQAAVEREVLIPDGATVRAPLHFVGRANEGNAFDVYAYNGLMTVDGEMILKGEGDAWTEMTVTYEIEELPGFAPLEINGKPTSL